MSAELAATLAIDAALGAPPSEIRIESDAVSVWQGGRGLGLLAIAFVFALIAAGVSAIFAIIGWLALTWGRRKWQARAARPRPALVRVIPGDTGGLVVERDGKRIGFELSKIADCWHWPDARGVNVVVATRKSMVSIQVPDRASAAALSRALGVDTSRQLVGTNLTAAPVSTKKDWRRFSSRHLPQVVALLSLFGLLSLMIPGVDLLPASVLAAIMFAALFTPTVIGLTRDALPARILVGRDGVLLSSFGRREFIGYERIKQVRRAPFAATLTLTNDEIVLLPLSQIKGRKRWSANPIDDWTRDPDKVRARRQALVEQIDTALTRFRNTDAAAAAAGRVLERGLRSIGEWREALSRASAGGYRETHVAAELLIDIVENPRSPIAQRMGAALALEQLPDQASAESNATRAQRIRAAIASSANPRVRIALERASEGTLDDAIYEDAVEAESAVAHSKAIRAKS